MAGIEMNPKERIADVGLDQIVQLAASDPNTYMFIPFHNGGVVGNHELLHIVANICR